MECSLSSEQLQKGRRYAFSASSTGSGQGLRCARILKHGSNRPPIRPGVALTICIAGAVTGTGSALDDWLAAERERAAAPLVGVADEERDIHITAYVPGADASEIAVDVLPDEIVVEADRNGQISVLHGCRMPARMTRIA